MSAKFYNNKFFQCLFVLLFGIATSVADANSNTFKTLLKINIGMHTGSFDKYDMKSIENVCEELRLFDDEPNHRMAIELILMCEAFAAANVKVDINVSPVPNYNRALRDANGGLIHTIAETVWSSSLTNFQDLYITQEVIRFGEFEKGIYTSPGHPLQKFKQTSLINFKDYSSVTFRHWEHDYKALREISGLVLTTIKFESLLNMLKAGRADFSLIEFPKNKSLEFTYYGVTVLPIKGVKVKVFDSRVFVISKKSKNSKEIFNALERGLTILRNEKRITPHYVKEGIITPAVKDWKVLNSPN